MSLFERREIRTHTALSEEEMDEWTSPLDDEDVEFSDEEREALKEALDHLQYCIDSGYLRRTAAGDHEPVVIDYDSFNYTEEDVAENQERLGYGHADADDDDYFDDINQHSYRKY